MIETIDARGLACPQPTVLTKSLIERGQLSFEIIVDNDVAKENIERIAKRMGYKVEESRKGTDIWLRLVKQAQGITEEIIEPKVETETRGACKPESRITTAVLMKSCYIGENDELGSVLMKGFLYSLTETTPRPESLFLTHSAVKMACSDSEHLENLELLKKQGVKIWICGTCLDYFGIKDKAVIGTITNMYDIVEGLMCADHVISM